MKDLKLYYVYDNVGECVISGPIPAANDLVALIGFRDTYIKKPDAKMPYSYKALDLVRFARVKVGQDGEMWIEPDDESTKVVRFEGPKVIDTINEMSVELGINDDLPDDIQEGKY